jgi:hypothetical protein
LIEDAMHGPSPTVRKKPTIVDVLEAIGDSVPKEAWDTLPSDYSEQLDHYLYGTPKR